MKYNKIQSNQELISLLNLLNKLNSNKQRRSYNNRIRWMGLGTQMDLIFKKHKKLNRSKNESIYF